MSRLTFPFADDDRPAKTSLWSGESALVAFTVLVPAAWGVAVCGLLTGSGGLAALVTLGCATVGMMASVAHLARPLRAPRSLTNVRSSWLSREIAMVGVFWACGAAWSAAVALGAMPVVVMAANLASAAVGAVLLPIIAKAYRVCFRPAWKGSEGLIELVGVGLGVGAALVGFIEPFAAAPAFIAASLACDAGAAGLRCRRLKESDDVGAADALVRYRSHGKAVRAVVALDAAAFLLSLGALIIVPVPSIRVAWLVVAAAEIVAHTISRQVFYAIGVSHRFAARLLK